MQSNQGPPYDVPGAPGAGGSVIAGGSLPVVVSLRARGLASFSTVLFFKWSYHIINLFQEFADMLLSFALSCYLLSWTSWCSLLITVIAIASNMTANQSTKDISIFAPFMAYIVLPLILMIHHVMVKRRNAQQALGQWRVAYVAIRLQAAALAQPLPAMPYTVTVTKQPPAAQHTQTQILMQPDGEARVNAQPTLHQSLPPLQGASPACKQPGVSDAAEDLTRILTMLADDLHRYCAHKRPYARHIYPPYRVEYIKADTLYKVSREIGLLSRRLLRTMREVIVRVGCLRDALSSVPVWDTGQSTAHRAQMAADTGLLAGNQSICVLLGQQVTQLHTAVEQLMSIKEAATPLLLRSVVRWIVTWIMPIFMSWYWLTDQSVFHDSTAARGGVLAVVTQLCLVVLLDTSVSLEDPFDELSLNGVSLAEAMDMAAMMSTEGDAARLDWLYNRGDANEDNKDDDEDMTPRHVKGGGQPWPDSPGPLLYNQANGSIATPPMPP